MAPSLSQNYFYNPRQNLGVSENFWSALYVAGHDTAVLYRSAAQPPPRPHNESSPVTLTHGIRSLFPSVSYPFLRPEQDGCVLGRLIVRGKIFLAKE